MTESSEKDFKRISIDNEGGSSVATQRAVNLEVVSATAAAVVVANNGKNDIKVSEEGVAKLTFGFLDDMQGGDSSLEPGEVKTPPPGSSPATTKESTPSRLAAKPDPPAKVLVKETLAKAMKTVSQLEAEVCEEKVRAILELDAVRRKEETEKRKLEAEKRRQSGETDLEVERKRKAKEERKQIKKLKKAKKAAEIALNSCDEDDIEKSVSKKHKIVKNTESEESEGLCSSGPDDNNEDKAAPSEKHISVVSSAVAIPSMASRYPQHLPPPHLPPDAFMGGYRPMNPFIRGPRPDFSHGRGGGFIPRGRGGMRGRMPFQGFRPPFFGGGVGGNNPGGSGGPPRHHGPHGPHHVPHGPTLLRQQHNPLPNRGHSPILPPSTDLQWTKSKPSISYAFKVNREHKFHIVHTDVTTNKLPSENWEEDTTNEDEELDVEEDHHHKHHHKRKIRKKDKKNKSLTKKERKKSKKIKDKDTKKHKKNRSTISLTSSLSSTTKKKKSNKSSRRKIEKIRKSYRKTNKATPQQVQNSSEDTETTNEIQYDNEENDDNDDDEEEMPNEEEIRNTVENIKVEKIERTELKIEDLTLKVRPLIIKIEPEEKEKLKDKEETEEKEIEKDNIEDNDGEDLEKTFDMFADSPPPSDNNHKRQPKEMDIHISDDPKDIPSDSGCVTPPLPKLQHQKLSKSSLQNALEIQKRIDKLLQQDDIKLEAIEAAKEQLLKKTQKHQSAKDYHQQTLKEQFTPEREIHRDINRKNEEDSKKIKTSKEEEIFLKEKPKAYKEKETSKHKSTDSHKEKHRDSSKHREEKDDKVREKMFTSYKDKPKDVDRDLWKDKDKNKHKDKDYDKEKTRKDVIANYRNPFKRSLSRDRFFGKIDVRRRTRTKSRERDFGSKRRLSNDRKRADSSGYSSGRLSSKRRFSGSSSASTTIFNRSKSGERDFKGSLDSLNLKDKDRKEKKMDTTPDVKHKRKDSSSPKRKSYYDFNKAIKTKELDRTPEMEAKSTTPPPPKTVKADTKPTNKKKDTKKSKSPTKQANKKRPLSFTQTEFLFPEEGNDDDFLLPDDDETIDSFVHDKSPSDKDDSPDTDDYMDNWENDEDVDLDINSNTPGDSSTPTRPSSDLAEEDSFVTRFANPSPPSEVLQKQAQIGDEEREELLLPLTPPLDLLKQLPLIIKERENISQSNEQQTGKKPELFGMQELYDQFIKSVEASGVDIKSAAKESPPKEFHLTEIEAETSREEISEIVKQTDDPLSTSSTSTTSSSSSSSSESNSSSSTSSSSSSASSSEDSNDADSFKKSTKNPSKKLKLEEINASTDIGKNESSNKESLNKKQPATPPLARVREPRTPSPTPLQKSFLMSQTPPTPASQTKAPKSNVAKDFKKLKSLEANLSRIQMMRANYDSTDEISEELHKMEMLFLQEKKLILQKYAKNSQVDKTIPTTPCKKGTNSEFIPALPTTEMDSSLPPPPPPEEPNKIFDSNREAIKLTISPLKLPSKPAIFHSSVKEEVRKVSKSIEDKDEMDFTEKLVKPAKEVAIVKPMMETKESKESRSRDSQRHQRRSPAYGNRDNRPRSPGSFRDRNRRSTSRTRFSPQRRGRGRSLSISPPRRVGGNVRHGTPPRRGAMGARFRVSNRRSRSRSRSRSPLRQFGNRRGIKDGSPFRRKRGGPQQQDTQMHYKNKFTRHRGSRSRSPRSPQTRPRSPRTPPPPRRRSYSQDRYSRSPLPFKPPSPPMRRSLSPLGSPNSEARRSRSPPRRPRSPRSPRSPCSPRSPRSPISLPPQPSSSRYDDHRHRRDSSFERHSSISPHPQYYSQESLASSVASQSSPYYYNVSPSRISLDARINIVLNGPAGGAETPPTGYEGYTNYAQYGGAAYMSIPPQPMTDPNGGGGYYQNPYVNMIPSTHEGHPHHHHHALPPPPHHAMHPSHTHPTNLPPHLTQHPPAYSNIPTINSGISGPASPANNFYYNDFNMGHHQHPTNPVLKELPKAPVAVQKGNVLEIVPSNVFTSQLNKPKTSPALKDSLKTQKDKVSSLAWKDEVNSRHVKAAVMRLNREGDSSMRSILKRSEMAEKTEKIEKKKVYFEDGIYPSRDSDDEDRQLIETRIRRKVLRLRKKCIELPAARDLVAGRRINRQKTKIDAALEKLPPPAAPTTMPAANLEQPIYLKPPTPVPLVYFHFDSVVHSMYVSQLEKPIPPRLLNPKCVPPGATTTQTGAGGGGGGGSTSNPTQSPNVNSPSGTSGGVATTSKKDLTTLAALNRISRNESQVSGSPKMMQDSTHTKRESPNLQQPPLMTLNKTGGIPFSGSQTSPLMPPLHTPPIRHPPTPIGFVGMRINNFMRLPPSPLARGSAQQHFQPPPPNMVMGTGVRHPQFNMPPPNRITSGMSPDSNYNAAPYGSMPTPPPGYNYNQRHMNPAYFMGSPPPHTIHPPAAHATHTGMQKDHHQQHKPPLPPPPSGNVSASPQAMIAPFNVKKTVN